MATLDPMSQTEPPSDSSEYDESPVNARYSVPAGGASSGSDLDQQINSRTGMRVFPFPSRTPLEVLHEGNMHGSVNMQGSVNVHVSNSTGQLAARRVSSDGITGKGSEGQSGPTQMHGSGGSPQIHGVVPTGPSNRFSDFRTRAIYSVVLLFGFAAFIAAGPVYCVILILLLTAAMYGELVNLKRRADKELHLPFFYSLRWYLFIVTVLTVYPLFLKGQLSVLAARHHSLAVYLKYHGLVSYGLLCAGLICFVLSLRKYTLKYQFQQLAWALSLLVVVVFQESAVVANLFSGLVWFVLPVTCVICNDISAYLVGSKFGRTPLIRLSPKKTVEGFIGAFFITLAWGYGVAALVEDSTYFVCPVSEISFTPCWSYWLAYFTKALQAAGVSIQSGGISSSSILSSMGHSGAPSLVSEGLCDYRVFALRRANLRMHGLVLAVFASLVAPFGGFLASGLKRAFKLKDFSSTIPGHGGLTDRFDCQILMGMFTYLYMSSFVPRGHALSGLGGAGLGSAGSLLNVPSLDHDGGSMFSDSDNHSFNHDQVYNQNHICNDPVLGLGGPDPVALCTNTVAGLLASIANMSPVDRVEVVRKILHWFPSAVSSAISTRAN